MSKVREWHATRSISLCVTGLGGRVIVLIHLVKERIFIFKPAHIPLFLYVVDVHLNIETLVQLLSCNVISSSGQLGVCPLGIYKAESLS